MLIIIFLIFRLLSSTGCKTEEEFIRKTRHQFKLSDAILKDTPNENISRLTDPEINDLIAKKAPEFTGRCFGDKVNLYVLIDKDNSDMIQDITDIKRKKQLFISSIMYVGVTVNPRPRLLAHKWIGPSKKAEWVSVCIKKKIPIIMIIVTECVGWQVALLKESLLIQFLGVDSLLNGNSSSISRENISQEKALRIGESLVSQAFDNWEKIEVVPELCVLMDNDRTNDLERYKELVLDDADLTSYFHIIEENKIVGDSFAKTGLRN